VPISTEPGQEPCYALHIPALREIVIEEAGMAQEEVRAYLDRSGIGGQIGVAAILFRDGEAVQSLRKCLGLENQHTVFEGKVMGMILVAELIRAEGHVRSTVIGVDSQAALWATVGTGGTSGQHLLAKLQAHLALAQCRCSNAGIVLTWTPGHDGIHKNKRADEEAK